MVATFVSVVENLSEPEANLRALLTMQVMDVAQATNTLRMNSTFNLRSV